MSSVGKVTRSSQAKKPENCWFNLEQCIVIYKFITCFYEEYETEKQLNINVVEQQVEYKSKLA